jgi:DNA-binding transcriptional LysR family regulator
LIYVTYIPDAGHCMLGKASPPLNRRLPRLNDRLDWNLLRTFLVIVQERSFSRAAIRLHITQPAVSQALKRLEDTLGCTLVNRGGSSVTPTRVGEEVYEIACDVYRHVSRLESELENQDSDITGIVRLLVMRIYSRQYDDFLAQFHRSYPCVEINIEVMRSADIVRAILQNSATAGIGICHAESDRLERHKIMTDRYAIYCGHHHKLFGQPDLSVDDLLLESYVALHSDRLGDSLSTLTIFREQQGFTGQVIAESTSLDEVRRLLYAGYGIGCLPESVARDDVAAGRLWPLPPSDGVATLDISLFWNRARRMTPAEQVFCEELSKLACLSLDPDSKAITASDNDSDACSKNRSE